MRQSKYRKCGEAGKKPAGPAKTSNAFAIMPNIIIGI
jgi:hypothetical protein